jgi:hypothetical protein
LDVVETNIRKKCFDGVVGKSTENIWKTNAWSFTTRLTVRRLADLERSEPEKQEGLHQQLRNSMTH